MLKKILIVPIVVFVFMLQSILVFSESVSFEINRKGANSRINAIAYNGNVYVAVGTQGLIFSSTNLEIWQENKIAYYNDILGVYWTGDRFIALGKDAILLSTDGENWSIEPSDGYNVALRKDGSATFQFINGEFFVLKDEQCVTTSDFLNFSVLEFPYEFNRKFPNRIVYSDNKYYLQYNGQLNFNDNQIAFLVSNNKKLWDRRYFELEGLNYKFLYSTIINNEYLIYVIDKSKLFVYSSKDQKIWDSKEILLDLSLFVDKDRVKFFEAENAVHVVYQCSEEKLVGNQVVNDYKHAVSNDGISFAVTNDRLENALYGQYQFSAFGKTILGYNGLDILYNKDGSKWSGYNIKVQELKKRSFIEYIGGEYKKIEMEFIGGEYRKVHNGMVLKSIDKVNWDNSNKAPSIPGYNGTYDMVRTDSGYIVRCNIYDYNMRDRSREPILDKIYFCDKDFNIIKEKSFGQYVGAINYWNGVYYCQTSDIMRQSSITEIIKGKTYMSTDGETWNEMSQSLSVPLVNNQNHIVSLSKEDTNNKVSEKPMIKPYISSDGLIFKDVWYENKKLSNLSLLGNWYISEEKGQGLGDHGKLYLSNDAVYWTKIDLPTNILGIRSINEDDDSIIIDTGSLILTCPKSGIYNELQKLRDNANTYVELDNKILGFDTPPVIEEGRTLVPLRFIFESMGAKVQWDDSAKSATVIKDGKKVTFAIDDKEAKVDGEIKKMDVPARLVGDKTMIPLRFISEELGYEVSWDEETQTASIKSK